MEYETEFKTSKEEAFLGGDRIGGKGKGERGACV